MSRRSTRLLLEDILEGIEKIERYTSTLNKDDFKQGDMVADAVVRNLEIIVEATSRLPVQFKKQHENIEWQKIIGLRNRIIHEYFRVDLEIVWQIIKSDLPGLEPQLKDLFQSEH